MRVALITNKFPPDAQDSPFPASLELARALQQLGHKVLVVTFTSGATGEDFYEGIRVIRRNFSIDEYAGMHLPVPLAFPNCLPQALDLYLWSRATMEEFRPDIVESQEFNGLGLFWALERRYPLVIRCYGPLTHLLRSGSLGDFPHGDVELVNAQELFCIGAADGLITICRDMAVKMGQWAGLPPSSFAVVRTPLTPVPEVFAHVEAGEDFPRLFYWGRVERQKGCDLLVEALPSIAREFPAFRLVIGGKETTENGASEPYGNIMRRRLQELGLADRVEFRGFMAVDDIRRQVSISDLCVFPSRYETACYAALEAITYGGCVAASRVGGLPEYVRHGISGWLFEPESAEALSAAVIKLARDEALRRSLRERARQDVVERCSPLKCARLSLNEYDRAIERFNQKAGAHRSFPAVTASLKAAMQDRSWALKLTERLSAAYAEGFAAGYEKATQDAACRSEDSGRSLVRRFARKVKSMIS